MLWLLLYSIWRGIRALIVLPPAKLPRLNPHATCPACGATSGYLVTVRLNTMRSEKGVTEPCMVEHNCNTCGARWYDKTILPDEKGLLIHPASLEHLTEGKLNATQ